MGVYYIDYLYREISLEEEDVENVPESGYADNACAEIADKEYIKEQFRYVPFYKLKEVVCRLCDNPEIKSRRDALMYIVWMAALDIKEKRYQLHNAPETKTDKDGFVWLIVTDEQARQLWKTSAFELFILYDDESEGLIETEERLEEVIGSHLQIGVEVGFLSNIINHRNK